MKPLWMSDPTLSNIPEEKLNYLSGLFDKVKCKNKNELMPFFMAMAKNKQQNISFTSDEMQRIIAAIKRAATKEEQAQIEKVIDMAAKKAMNNKSSN